MILPTKPPRLPSETQTSYDTERALREAQHRDALYQRRRERWQRWRQKLLPWL